MACRNIKSPITGQEIQSKTWNDLYNISKSEEDSDMLYNQLLSQNFMNWFGDWILNPISDDTTYDTGEPKIQLKDNNIIVTNKEGIELVLKTIEDTLYDPGVPPSGGLTKLYSLKNQLLSNLMQRVIKLEREIKVNRGNEKVFKELLTKKNNLNKKIEELGKELRDISNLNSKAPEVVGPYIETELNKLEVLTKSSSIDDTKEASNIIQFVKAIGNFNPIDIKKNGHPLFEYYELFDEEDNFLMTPEMEAIYKNWASKAELYERHLLINEKNIFTDVINKNDKVKELYENAFTYEDLIAAGRGMKDIRWVDMMIMDIGSGIFSHSGIVPQVMKNIVNDEFEKQDVWAKSIDKKITSLLPLVQAELKKLGYEIGIVGIKGVSYDLFRQKDEFGNNKSNIVDTYSFKWYDKISTMFNRFNQLIKIAESSDENTKEVFYKRAFSHRDNWYKNNTILLNPSLAPEIVSDENFKDLGIEFGTEEEQANHRKELVNLLGEKDYLTLIEKQKQKLNEYKVQKKVKLEETLALKGVNSYEELPEANKLYLKIWDYEYNPFLTYRSIYKGNLSTVGNNTIPTKNVYNIFVPNKAEYYDENYKIIKSNPVLSEFYDVIHEATSEMRKRFDYDVQNKLLDTSVPLIEKNMIELFLDRDMDFYQVLSEAFRRMIDSIKGIFGIKYQNGFSFAKVNVITGLPEYTINDSFISKNKDSISNLFKVEIHKFKNIFNSFSTNKLQSVGKNTVIVINNSNKKDIISALYPYTNITSYEELIEKYGTKGISNGEEVYTLPVGKIIYANSEHQIVQQQSFDLPKVIRTYANLTAQYSARKTLLPLMEVMKKHYENVGKQITNNVDEAIVNAQTGENRINGLRTNAIKQHEDWFQRVILGNYGLRKNYGFIKNDKQKENDAITNFLTMLVKGKWDGKIYNSAEKELIKDIDKIIAEGASEEDIVNLLAVKENLGKDFALSGVFDALLNFIRWRGLGFNISSGLRNTIEGQLANSITANTGLYFKPEDIQVVGLSDMVYGDFISKTNTALIPEKVAKATLMMDRYDVLQDASNELQKSTAKSRFSGLTRLNPYYMLKKGEAYNQTPLMVAILKNTPIKDKNGNESNVWDATEGVYNPEIKKWNFKLKEDYRTEDNIKTWEEADGQEYFNFKSKIRQVIKNTHGDFDSLSGMMAKSTHSGQALLMFKTWLPRELYKRFAVEQDDVQAGVKGFKGRYRSHTPATLATQLGLVGTFAFGPVGGIIAGTTGAGIGLIFGKKSSIGFLQEMIMVNTLLARKMLGIPVNFVSRKVTGKNFITEDRQKEFDKLKSKDFTEVDYANFKGNLQDIAIMFANLSLLLLTKAFLWDDDDDEDDGKRQAHNLLANQFMQLASQASMYVNGIELYKTMTDISIIKFFKDCSKALTTFNGLVEGHDTIPTGINAGESAFGNAASKLLLPGVIANPSTIGFESQMERQFQKSPFDRYFWGEEKILKNEVSAIKADYKNKLQEENPEISDEEINKMVREKYRNKKKDETYEEYMQDVGIEKE